MKTQLFVAALIAVVALHLSSCADQTATTTTAKNPDHSSYNRQDLARTTRTDAAGAIQAADPSVGRGR